MTLYGSKKNLYENLICTYMVQKKTYMKSYIPYMVQNKTYMKILYALYGSKTKLI